MFLVFTYLSVDLNFMEVRERNLQAHLDERSQTWDSMLVPISASQSITSIPSVNWHSPQYHVRGADPRCVRCLRSRFHPLPLTRITTHELPSSPVNDIDNEKNTS